MRHATIALASLAMMFGSCLCSAADLGPIADNAKATKPLAAGDAAPDVSLTDVEGKEVKLSSLYAKQPLVVVFFRAVGAPSAHDIPGELIKAYPKILDSGAQLVAVSPDSVSNSLKNVEKNSIPFSVYSDAQVQAARAFGIAFKLDDKTLTRYKGFGIDLVKASGFDHNALPVPAVFVIDTSGKILFAHSDPDHTASDWILERLLMCVERERARVEL